MANVLFILSTIIDCIVFIANVSVLDAAAAWTTVRIILWASAQPCKTLEYLQEKLPHGVVIVQELCESRGGRLGLSVLTSLLVSVDVKLYWSMLRRWSQLVPNMSRQLTLSSTTYPWSCSTAVVFVATIISVLSGAVGNVCLVATMVIISVVCSCRWCTFGGIHFVATMIIISIAWSCGWCTFGGNSNNYQYCLAGAVGDVRSVATMVTVTGPAARSSFYAVQGEAGDCQGETLTMEYTIVSSLLDVVCILMILALPCSKSPRPTGLVSRKKPVVLVFGLLLICPSELGVPSHYVLYICHQTKK